MFLTWLWQQQEQSEEINSEVPGILRNDHSRGAALKADDQGRCEVSGSLQIPAWGAAGGSPSLLVLILAPVLFCSLPKAWPFRLIWPRRLLQGPPNPLQPEWAPPLAPLQRKTSVSGLQPQAPAEQINLQVVRRVQATRWQQRTSLVRGTCWLSWEAWWGQVLSFTPGGLEREGSEPAF